MMNEEIVAGIKTGPLPNYSVITSDTVPRIEASFHQNFILRDLDIKVPFKGAYARRQHIPLIDVSLNYLDFGANIYFEAFLDDCYMVQLPGDYSYTIHRGEKSFLSNNKIALVLSPTLAFRWELPRFCKGLSVRIKRQAVENRLSELLGRAVEEPIVFSMVMEVNSGHGLSWYHLLCQVIQQLSLNSSILQHKIVSANYESLLINGLLFGQPHNYSDELRRCGEVSIPTYLQRAKRFILGNLREEINLDDIVHYSETSHSRLHNGFKQYLGMSPINYLVSARMNGARQDIINRKPHQTISGIAMDWGFSHLGRFSKKYKETYGESPSETPSRTRAAAISGKKQRE